METKTKTKTQIQIEQVVYCRKVLKKMLLNLHSLNKMEQTEWSMLSQQEKKDFEVDINLRRLEEKDGVYLFHKAINGTFLTESDKL